MAVSSGGYPMMDETQAKEVLAEATAPPQAKPGQLVDPPDLARYAQRGDPPMSEWPGRIVGRKDLMMAMRAAMVAGCTALRSHSRKKGHFVPPFRRMAKASG